MDEQRTKVFKLDAGEDDKGEAVGSGVGLGSKSAPVVDSGEVVVVGGTVVEVVVVAAGSEGSATVSNLSDPSSG